MIFLTLDINEFLQPVPSARLLAAIFLAILFLQSGTDKVFDWMGNLEWLKQHFGNSPLKNKVPLLLGIVTIFELASGFTSLAGALVYFFTGSIKVALIGAQLAAVSLLMLFFGQRMAKDYEGAASLVGYFILVLIAIVLFG